MRKLLLSIASLLSAYCSFAQPGILDNTFGNNGISSLHAGPYLSSEAYAIAIQPDRKVLLAGWASDTSNISNSSFMVGRLNKNGTPDLSFHQTGYLLDSFSGNLPNIATCMALQPDGKILVAGFTGANINTQTKFAIARYTADGSPDLSFNGSGKTVVAIGTHNDEIFDLKLLPNGKILVCGFSRTGTYTEAVIAKFNSDGTLDQTFNGTGSVLTHVQSNTNGSDEAKTLIVQSDGKIVIGGLSESQVLKGFLVARYNADGTPDNTFNTNGFNIIPAAYTSEFSSISSALLQPDGKIIASAQTDFGIGYLLRFNPDGTLDNTFRGSGIDTIAVPYGAQKIALQSDSKILVTGTTSGTSKISLLRFNSDGSLDNSFAGNGIVTTAIDPGSIGNWGDNIALDSNRIYVSGSLHEDTDVNMVAIAYLDDITLTVTNPGNTYSIITNVYPNPASNNINITIPVAGGVSVITIYNGLGQLVRTLQAATGVTTVTANIHELPAGTYNIVCKQQNKLSSKMFIKQ